MNKVDDFFKNKFDQSGQKDEGWNMPSDQLWENIVDELPQKKSKRRFFLIIFNLFGIALSLIYISFQAQPFVELNQNSQKYTHFQESAVLNLKSETQTNNSINNIEIVNQTNQQKTTDLNIARNSEEVANKTINAINTLDRFSNGINTNEHDSKSLITKQAIIESTKKLNPVVNVKRNQEKNRVSDSSVSLTSSSSSSSSLNNGDFKSPFLKEVEAEIVHDQLTLQEEFNKSIESELPKDMIKNLPSLELDLLREVVPYEKSEFLFIEPLKYLKKKPDFELGLAHSFTVFSLVNFIDLSDVDTSSEVAIQGASYKNINLSYSKWLSGKFSFSTGFIYSSLSMNLCLDNDFMYGSNDLSDLISQEYNSVVNRVKNIKSNDDVYINLKNGIVLEKGDELNLKGKVDLALRAYQLPIHFNYHFYNRRVDYHLGLGASVDYVVGSERNIQLSLYRNLIQISKDENYNNRVETYLDYSIYFRSGFRRKIYKNLKFGMDLRIALIEPIFSSIDVGLYYRWHK